MRVNSTVVPFKEIYPPDVSKWVEKVKHCPTFKTNVDYFHSMKAKLHDDNINVIKGAQSLLPKYFVSVKMESLVHSPEPIRMVRPLWCGHYGVYNSVWGFYGAGFLWRATIMVQWYEEFFALWNFWWPL